MKRPDCIRHWRDVEGADDSTYPDSDELFSIGAPLARKLGLGRIGIHHERLPPGAERPIRMRRATKKSLFTCSKATLKPGLTATCGNWSLAIA